jgi:hypothetical protein
MPIAVVFVVMSVTQKSGSKESYYIVVSASYRHVIVRMYRSYVCVECVTLECVWQSSCSSWNVFAMLQLLQVVNKRMANHTCACSAFREEYQANF